jgi:hypothetical protein
VLRSRALQPVLGRLGWQPVPGLLLTPPDHLGDGFRWGLPERKEASLGVDSAISGMHPVNKQKTLSQPQHHPGLSVLLGKPLPSGPATLSPVNPRGWEVIWELRI